MYEVQKVHILPLYLLVKAYQQLSLFAHYDAYNSLNVFTIPPKPAPSGCCYRVGNLVPTASHPGITPHACVGRLHLMEQAVNSNHNTLVNNYIKRHRVARQLAYNGTAIWLGDVTRRSSRPGTCPDRPGHCPGARRVWRNFCKSRRIE